MHPLGGGFAFRRLAPGKLLSNPVGWLFNFDGVKFSAQPAQWHVAFARTLPGAGFSRVESSRHGKSNALTKWQTFQANDSIWQQVANFLHKDLQLLDHEYFESRFEGIFKTNYRTAHEAANRSGRLSELEYQEHTDGGKVSFSSK